MISRCLYVGLLLVALTALACPVIAWGTYPGAAGYAVRPATGAGLAIADGSVLAFTGGHLIAVAMVSDIGPGERKHHVKNVDRDIMTLNVDLAWQNPDVSLKLLVYSPGGIQFGPWDDMADGRQDHEINMDIDNPGGIEKGQWHYYVIYDAGVARTGYTV